MPIPKTFFLNMPDEVRELWLEPIAERYGWPFASASKDDPPYNSKWSYVFGCRWKLDEVAKWQWRMGVIDLRSEKLTPTSIQAIEGLIPDKSGKLKAPFANLERTEDRLRACADYIRETGSIPKPVIAARVSGGFDILDGHHRIAAYTFSCPHDCYKIPAWIALAEEVEDFSE